MSQGSSSARGESARARSFPFQNTHRSWLSGRPETPGRDRRSAPCGLPGQDRRNRDSPADWLFPGAVPGCVGCTGRLSRSPLQGAIHIGFIDLPADFAVVQISHQRDVAGGLQSESPGGRFESLRCGAGARHGHGALRQPGQLVLGRRITSSNSLVESSTFSENRMVSLDSSTSIAAMRSLPAASSSAPWRRKLSMVFSRNRRRAPERLRASSVFE